jgi:transcriptional regulator with XRE-family HTH domain
LIRRSQSAVSQIENGEVGLSIDLLRLIVSELGGTLEITAVFDDRRIALSA